MKRVANEELRKYSKANGVCLWEVAVEMGVAEATLIRWLRLPLSEEKKIQFINAVDKISQNRED